MGLPGSQSMVTVKRRLRPLQHGDRRLPRLTIGGRGLPSENNIRTGTVSAVVPLSSAQATTVALTAAPGGPNGSFAATTLSPSATWSAEGNSGDFSWSYPMRVPPSLGGPTPSIVMSYSLSSVDGRMPATNTSRPRSARASTGPPATSSAGTEPGPRTRPRGANNPDDVGDLCWATDNAILSIAGHAGELIKDGTDPNRWHLRNDDRTYIQHRTGAGNGARDGEHWMVTTTDGTQYWFGRLPTSTLVVPVFGITVYKPRRAVHRRTRTPKGSCSPPAPRSPTISPFLANGTCAERPTNTPATTMADVRTVHLICTRHDPTVPPST
jgi:hypothetical protein